MPQHQSQLLLRAIWDISGKQYLSEGLANCPSVFEEQKLELK